jgi:hypothetical protein
MQTSVLRRVIVYPGDWIPTLLGATVVVGSGMMVVGGSAILFALLHAARGVDGLARARSLPPGIADHAEEVRARIRSRYMLRARPLSDIAAPIYMAFEIETADPIAIPIAALIADAATMPITKLPPLNESLRRGLAARAPRAPHATRAPLPPHAVEPKEPAAVQRRRKARRGKPKAASARSAAGRTTLGGSAAWR